MQNVHIVTLKMALRGPKCRSIDERKEVSICKRMLYILLRRFEHSVVSLGIQLIIEHIWFAFKTRLERHRVKLVVRNTIHITANRIVLS